MGDGAFSSDRIFQVWTYTVGHASLLLRSPKETAGDRRIELLFLDVAGLQLPTTLRGLNVSMSPVAEGTAAAQSIAEPRHRLFVCRTNGFDGWVVAGAMAWREDDLEYYDASSLLEQ